MIRSQDAGGCVAGTLRGQLQELEPRGEGTGNAARNNALS